MGTIGRGLPGLLGTGRVVTGRPPDPGIVPVPVPLPAPVPVPGSVPVVAPERVGARGAGRAGRTRPGRGAR